MKKRTLIITGAVLIVGIVGAIYIFNSFNRTRQVKQLQVLVDREQAATQGLLLMEKKSPTVNYNELFAACDKDIAARSACINELKTTAYDNVASELKDSITRLFNNTNEFVKQKRKIYKLQLDITNTYDEFHKFLAVSQQYDEATQQMITTRLAREGQDNYDRLKDEVTESIKIYSKLTDGEDNLKKMAEKENLKVDTLFKRNAVDVLKPLINTIGAIADMIHK